VLVGPHLFMAIDKNKNPDQFLFITERNLLRQYEFLQDRVKVALETNDLKIDHPLICQLNFQAVVLLCDSAGQYRNGPIAITNSSHQPPSAADVPGFMEELLSYLSAQWTSGGASHLAAYALWFLNWIHPFEEGNGRTARAACLLIMCLKHQLWLPGKEIIPKQIRENRQPYYEVLRHADEHFKSSKRKSVNVSKTEAYLNDLLAKQLNS
jgi:fido (protein-threonine AMPylation protein)